MTVRESEEEEEQSETMVWVGSINFSYEKASAYQQIPAPYAEIWANQIPMQNGAQCWVFLVATTAC